MDDFEAHRAHLRSVAHRILGRRADVDDALQETWLRFDRADRSEVRDLRAWLTTVAARVCLDILRTRKARAELPLQAEPADERGPAEEAALADSVGLALLVVLDRLTPAERVAFVLHDLFALPFEQVAAVLDRSVPAAKMLASRARRRVRRTEEPPADPARQWRVVEAFLNASRNGDFEALLALLDPDVVARAGEAVVRGAPQVGRQALAFSRGAEHARVEAIDGVPAIVVAPGGRIALVLRFAFVGDRIAAIDINDCAP